MLLTFAGPAALSDFRRLPLLQRCRALLPDLTDLQADYFYIVQLQRPLDAAARQRLSNILDVENEFQPQSDSTVLVCPRPGTISPWSSKATDILHNCGMDAVKRVERGIAYRFDAPTDLSTDKLKPVLPLLYDRMIEAVVTDVDRLFQQIDPRPLVRIPLQSQGRAALEQANVAMGLALSAEEIDYFIRVFATMQRDPTDVELMMFSVVNSEHCRHKIFNAEWIIDGQPRPHSLFDMIRHTHAQHPQGCIKAYSDNSSVIQGFPTQVFRPLETADYCYSYTDELVHVLLKVETHNHPTAISPFPGASTGVGGEIRDEGATGTGGQFQAGLCAFFTSHLRLPDFAQPWEQDYAEFPTRLATPREIMTEGPIGGAAFGNEFGRPNIVGVFRTYEEMVAGRYRGYHKPIMVAGGVGLIDAIHVEKKRPQQGDYVIQIGGPAMLIGLGGGSASSMDVGSNLEDLDFASVQRDNPEMERRCQELINRCIALGENNPILSIHDIGAGGLSNACPELVEATGATFDLRAIKNDDPGMSPMEIWSNEAQERYVLVIGRDDLARFEAMATRERCLFAAIGQISDDNKLHLHDDLLDDDPIDQLDLEVILGKPPRLQRDVQHTVEDLAALDLQAVDLSAAVRRLLRFPAVASKTFLISIADRSVTGLVARDQMVGPFQVPVADLGMTAHSFTGYSGSAMAMGERAPLALIDAPASGRMAIAEAVTNIAAAHIGAIHHIKLSGNWMCACGEAGEDAKLYDTVQAVGLEFCPAVGLSIPVGKDSLSMRAVWQDSQGDSHTVAAPLSLVISSFAPVPDIRRHATPDLKPHADSRLLLIDLGRGLNRLGGSVLAQTYNQLGDQGPDIAPQDLRRLYDAVQEMLAQDLILAYHDRSDGGLFITLAEMGFAGRCGMQIDITSLGDDPLAALFAEEIGVVVQCATADQQTIDTIIEKHDLQDCTHTLGHPTNTTQLDILHQGATLFSDSIIALHQSWSETTYHMQALRDNPTCAREEFDAISATSDPGLNFHLTYEPAAAHINTARPRIAVLREQGINGQVEMAAAFDRAGFAAVDTTMTDLISGRTDLANFQGLVACGGFSYGDVLGAGAGWARSILFHQQLRQMFATFFARSDTFGLGVCNGCQMFSHLKELIPGAELWPRFLRNRSEQFEARYVTVEILASRSVLFPDMAGSRLPIACAHGEGRIEFANSETMDQASANQQVCMRYVDNYGQATERYPFNPNGSPQGLTSLTTTDGRVTIMMPHPERVFRNVQLSYRPDTWTGEEGPWLKLFNNAYTFASQT